MPVTTERGPEQKRLWVAMVLWCFGWLGAHRFYLRDWGWGMIYLLTGGLFTLGWLADAFLLPGLVDEFNRRALDGERLAPARLVRQQGHALPRPRGTKPRGALRDPPPSRLSSRGKAGIQPG